MKNTKLGRTFLTVCCGLAVALALGACRPEEQGRILMYKKGVYLGQKDKPLSASAHAAARSRTWAQAALGSASLPNASRAGGTTVVRTGFSGRISGQRAP